MPYTKFVLDVVAGNAFARDYAKTLPQAMQFFADRPDIQESYRRRLEWLRQKPFPHRQELAAGLTAFNRQIGNEEAALANIETLKRPDAVVVIAGQQAGVLTGPLYTIYKAMQVIKTAAKLSREWGVPVVPVFWIAGEDHDLDEINHVTVRTAEGRIEKVKFPMKTKGMRKSAAHIPLSREQAKAFVDAFLQGQWETQHTREIRKLLLDTVQEADTPANWFARLMARLFGRYGLVLVESSLPFVRKLEQDAFRLVLQRNEELAERVMATAARLQEAGYAVPVDLHEKQAHLFVYEGGERLLLERDGDRFVTKDGRFSYSREQLLDQLEQSPERFSPNVLTRPFMQEHAFPVLSFIGGPGEIAYWALLRDYFEAFDCRLPLVLPRHSYTLLEGAVSRQLEQLGLTLELVYGAFPDWKQKWLEERKEHPVMQRFAHVREAIRELYQPLVEEVAALDRGLNHLAGKNAERLLQQVDFLRKKTEQSLLLRHEVEWKRIIAVENALVPGGEWQERVYNLFAYMNLAGMDLLDRLMELPLPERLAAHEVVCL